MNKGQKSSWLKHIDFSILDLICLELAFLTAYLLYFHEFSLYTWDKYGNFALLLLAMDIVVDFVIQNHRDILRRESHIELGQTIKQVSGVMISMIFILFCMKDSALYSRIILVSTWIIAVIYTFIGRYFLKKWLRNYHKKHKKLPHALVFTTENEAKECAYNLQNRKLLDVNIRGILLLDKDAKGSDIEGIPVIANRSDIFSYVMEHVVDEVFVNTHIQTQELNELLDVLIEMGITIHINVDQLYMNYPNIQMNEFNGYTVVTSSVKDISLEQRFLKRCMDIAGGLVGSLITLFLCILIGPIIYIKDPGPIFFTQERVGKNGRKFKMYKFRSMYMDAEERKKELLDQNEMDGFMFKLTEDPRIIGSRFVEENGEKIYKSGFGGFLRSSSLDEMPQFFNVLKGDMSLIGTRPPTADEVEQYDYHHKVRLSMRPGITGLWQVSGRSDITDFEEVVRLDKQYIVTWSLALDIKILFKTIVVVFSRKGSR